MRRLVLLLALAACKKDPTDPAGGPPPGAALLEVEETSSVVVPNLDGEAYVIRTTADVPYVYASTREDLARASGFVVATDRFFMIDMIRRLSQGRLSEVLGDSALAADQEARGIGMARVADQILRLVQRDTRWAGILDAYAEGVNAYIAEVNANRLPPPSEYTQLGPVLGASDPRTLLEPFDRRDMAAVAATLVYNLGFETGDVGRAESYAALETLFDGAPLGELREAGVYADIWNRVEPTWPVSSAPGWGTSVQRTSAVPNPAPRSGALRVERSALSRLARRLERIERRQGHDHESGFGSNAWAVAGTHTADGRSLLAGDGHLPLSIPSLFYAIGMDTALLGGEDLSQVGLVLPGFPTLAVGTNGKVAWSQTQLFGDITDWYSEQLQLGADGRPSASLFQGEWRPLVGVEESYVVADVDFLESVGRTETWTRWETFDGRLLAEVEGREAAPGDPLEPGEALINVQGVYVVPQDLDGDGAITAVSLDHAAFDDGNLILASDGFGRAQDVYEFREATRGLVAYSQNVIASDANGDIFYTGYQAVPCRSYLPRESDGGWAEGADPSRLLDGTRFGGFTIPVRADGTVDESFRDDPTRCVVPFEEYPQSISPNEGYVQTANNDIGNISTDGSLLDDPWYIGGPWLEGYRAKRIVELLEEQASTKTASIEGMAQVQGDHRSVVAEHWLGDLLEPLDRAESLVGSERPLTESEARMVALWTANEARFAEARDRLRAWRDRGLRAESGVETFYDPVQPGDAEDAVATMLWNAWIGEFMIRVFDDEGMPGVWNPTGDAGRTRTLKRMLLGRGPRNPEGMASWNPDTQESVFFDIKDTPELETSGELSLIALQAALDALTAPPLEDGIGGFGTPDMDQWLWGYRHLVKFESLLGEVFSEDDDFGFLVELFSITPDELPLGEGIPSSDPRSDLPWFPRDGDHLNVDAGNPGFTRDEYMYGSGPVFRMVIALGPDGAEGINTLPGGQSGIKDSPHFSDQAALWLGNDTLPMLTTVEAVTAAATGRITLRRE